MSINLDPSKLTPDLSIEGENLFTIQSIANALSAAAGVPVAIHHIKKLVRDGKLSGRKIAKAYLISGSSFVEYIKSGHFEYKARPPRRVQRRTPPA